MARFNVGDQVFFSSHRVQTHRPEIGIVWSISEDGYTIVFSDSTEENVPEYELYRIRG